MLALKETWEWRKDKKSVDIFIKIQEGQTLQKNQFKFVLKLEKWSWIFENDLKFYVWLDCKKW